MKAKDSTSSSDEIAVFQAYIDPDQLGAGDHLGAHNALLVANWLSIGELAISPTALLEKQMGGTCNAECRPPHQGRMGRDHRAGMVGDATAC